MRVRARLLYSPLLFVVAAAVGACANGAKAEVEPPSPKKAKASASVPAGAEVAVFAGGCFWCVQPPYDAVEGVLSTRVGFTGGPEVKPSYKDVAYGRTGHTEAIEVVYDPKKVTYEALLDVFWRNMDPTDLGGQFVDRGSQYRPEIFVYSPAQREAAKKSKEALQKSGRFDRPVVVPITDGAVFWPAEDYHQKYYKKSPARYYGYRRGSGRDAFIEKYWGAKKR